MLQSALTISYPLVLTLVLVVLPPTRWRRPLWIYCTTSDTSGLVLRVINQLSYSKYYGTMGHHLVEFRTPGNYMDQTHL